MKTMKELEAMSEKDIAALVATERAELQKHRFGTAGRDVSAIHTAKKNIARALTVLTARNQATTK